MSELTPLRRNRDFLLLQVGQLFSSFGSNMSRIAYPLLALAVTGSAADAGYVSAVLFVPLLAFSLVAGVAADRLERRRLMIVSDVVAAAALAVLAGAIIAGRAHLWLILVVGCRLDDQRFLSGRSVRRVPRGCAAPPDRGGGEHCAGPAFRRPARCTSARRCVVHRGARVSIPR
jgi:MFS family permease